MSDFKTSANGRKFIELWEGLYLHTYDDGTGTLTIGYGHTTAAGPPAVHRGQTITQAQADAILAEDLGKVEVQVNRLVRVTINQNQFDALVSFDFNTGGLGRSSLLRSINQGDFSQVQADLAMWDRGGGRVMPGLLRRRQAEYLLFTTGEVKGP